VVEGQVEATLHVGHVGALVDHGTGEDPDGDAARGDRPDVVAGGSGPQRLTRGEARQRLAGAVDEDRPGRGEHEQHRVRAVRRPLRLVVVAVLRRLLAAQRVELGLDGRLEGAVHVRVERRGADDGGGRADADDQQGQQGHDGGDEAQPRLAQHALGGRAGHGQSPAFSV